MERRAGQGKSWRAGRAGGQPVAGGPQTASAALRVKQRRLRTATTRSCSRLSSLPMRAKGERARGHGAATAPNGGRSNQSPRPPSLNRCRLAARSWDHPRGPGCLRRRLSGRAHPSPPVRAAAVGRRQLCPQDPARTVRARPCRRLVPVMRVKGSESITGRGPGARRRPGRRRRAGAGCHLAARPPPPLCCTFLRVRAQVLRRQRRSRRRRSSSERSRRLRQAHTSPCRCHKPRRAPPPARTRAGRRSSCMRKTSSSRPA